jgi:MYXO-CTERM domain-containing protein
VPAPAVSPSGMLIAVLLLAGVGVVGLAQRRRRTLPR